MNGILFPFGHCNPEGSVVITEGLKWAVEDTNESTGKRLVGGVRNDAGNLRLSKQDSAAEEEVTSEELFHDTDCYWTPRAKCRI